MGNLEVRMVEKTRETFGDTAWRRGVIVWVPNLAPRRSRVLAEYCSVWVDISSTGLLVNEISGFPFEFMSYFHCFFRTEVTMTIA